MSNDNLRQALERAGIHSDELAEIVGVDTRTIRRWLKGTTPHPRQRTKVARALDTTEHQLWPHVTASTATQGPGDPVYGYRTATDLTAPDWKTMMRDATERIDLLGTTLQPILDTPGVGELLATKAASGCEVRILLSDPRDHLAPYVERDQIAIRVLDRPAKQTIYRFDQHLLLTLQLHDHDEQQAPLLHVRRAGAGGLFDRLTDHYTHCWENAARPINFELDFDVPQDRAHLALATDQQPTGAEPPTARRTPPNPPRRWPRRPT